MIKSRWPSRSDSLGIPRPFVSSPGLKAWCGVQNFHNIGRTSLLLLFSSLWSPTWCAWDLILLWLHPSYYLTEASSCLWMGISFFGGFQRPSVNGYSTASWDFGVLTGGNERTSFYSTILKQMASVQLLVKSLLLTCPFLFLLPVLLVSNPKLLPKPTSRKFFPMLSSSCFAISSL